MAKRVWGIRRTDDRDALVERLRSMLAASGRDVEKIHGVVVTTAIFDEALKELEKVLRQQATTGDFDEMTKTEHYHPERE